MTRNNLQCYFNGQDWVIAEDEADATGLFCERYGERPDDYEGMLDWKKKDPNAKLRITIDSDPDEQPEAKTIDEIIKLFGRGFLASTEW